MKAFSEVVDDCNYIEILLSENDIFRLERGILVCGVVEANLSVYNIAVRLNKFPFVPDPEEPKPKKTRKQNGLPTTRTKASSI